MIGNKVANKSTRISNNSEQINSGTALYDHDKETPKEREISLEKKFIIWDQ